MNKPLTSWSEVVLCLAKKIIESLLCGLERAWPAFDQTLNLYRKGVKVAEVKVTGPKLDENIVADLAQGSAEIGDDVRDH